LSEDDDDNYEPFNGNPFADVIQHELDLRIIYQKVRKYLEMRNDEKVSIEIKGK
jgi:hypothetical protein